MSNLHVRTQKRVTFSTKDEINFIEPFVSSGEGRAHMKGLSPIFVSTFSIIFVLLAIVLLPLDSSASHVMESPPGGAFSAHSAESANINNNNPASSPKRAKFVGKSFDAKDLYEAYKEVETEYHTKAFRDVASWRVLATRQDVEVSMMEHPSDPNCPYVKMVAIIPASVQECWGWLSLSNWPKNMPKMDPFYEGVELHGDFDYKGVNMILARKRTRRILAFGKRDIVFLSVSDQPLSDGTWVSGSVSVETPQLPRQTGYTRAFQDSIAFYKPLDGNTSTHVTIVCRIDLNDSTSDGAGGWIPMWVYVKTIGGTGVRSVTSMRDEITKEHDANKSSLEPVEEKGDRNRFLTLWKRKMFRKKGKSDPSTDDVSSMESTTSRRWKFPWVKEARISPVPTQVLDDEPLPPDARRHRVPWLFFKQ
jgi:hypothetical protein